MRYIILFCALSGCCQDIRPHVQLPVNETPLTDYEAFRIALGQDRIDKELEDCRIKKEAENQDKINRELDRSKREAERELEDYRIKNQDAFQDKIDRELDRIKKEVERKLEDRIKRPIETTTTGWRASISQPKTVCNYSQPVVIIYPSIYIPHLQFAHPTIPYSQFAHPTIPYSQFAHPPTYIYHPQVARPSTYCMPCPPMRFNACR